MTAPARDAQAIAGQEAYTLLRGERGRGDRVRGFAG
jgi:hypothetical protein